MESGMQKVPLKTFGKYENKEVYNRGKLWYAVIRATFLLNEKERKYGF